MSKILLQRYAFFLEESPKISPIPAVLTKVVTICCINYLVFAKNLTSPQLLPENSNQGLETLISLIFNYLIPSRTIARNI